MLLDYVIAYALVFLCGFAATKKLGWLWGTVLGSFGRWISLTLSGGLLWYMYMPETFLGLPMVNPWVYSILYNAVVVGIVMIVDLVVLGIMQAISPLRKVVFAKQS